LALTFQSTLAGNSFVAVAFAVVFAVVFAVRASEMVLSPIAVVMEFLFDQGHSEAEAQGAESVEARRVVAWQKLGL
jgi:hypothetical protein